MAERSDEQEARRRRYGALRRIAPILFAVALLGLLLATGVWRKISLEEIRDRRAELKAFVTAHPVESLLLYIAAYAGLVALSAPGALIMTLAGGFLFGALKGGLAATVGVSLGALVMFLLANTALGEVLSALAPRGGRVEQLAEAVRRHAFFTILSLRLMPAAPIWVVNIAAVLVRAPLGTYLAATVIGVAPSSLLYASVGSGLDRIFAERGPPAVAGLFRPSILLPLLGLAALALAPLAVSLLLNRRR